MGLMHHMTIRRLANLGGVLGALCLAAALAAPLSSPAAAWGQDRPDLAAAGASFEEVAQEPQDDAPSGVTSDGGADEADASDGQPSGGEGGADVVEPVEPDGDGGTGTGGADVDASDGSSDDKGASGDASDSGADADSGTDASQGADKDEADKGQTSGDDSFQKGDASDPDNSSDQKDSDNSDNSGSSDGTDEAERPVGTPALRFYAVTAEGKVAYASLSDALAAAGVTRAGEGAPLGVALDAAHDAAHAGMSLGELAEADLALALAKQLAGQAGDTASLNLSLVRTSDQPLAAGSDEVSELAARLSAAKQAGADVLVELHVNLSGVSELPCATPATDAEMPVVVIELYLEGSADQLDCSWLGEACQQMGQGAFDPVSDSVGEGDSAEAVHQARASLADQLKGLAEGLAAYSQAVPVDADADIDPQANDGSSASTKFVDTPADSWYVTGGYLDYVVQAGLMNGYTDGSGKFAPEVSITREQVVTVLYRYSGASYSSNVSHFSDVATGQYYTAAVEWAYQNGVVTGYDGTGRFGVGDPIKREDFCTMLYRFARRCGVSGSLSSLSGFPDGSSVDSWAKDGVAWCVSKGVITGDESWNPARINPQGNTRRCEAAKMFTVLMRDVLKGAQFNEVAWGFSGVSSSTSYILSSGTATISPKLTGTTSGLTYEYGWTSTNGDSWSSGKQSASSYTMYFGGTGTFTITVKVSDSTGVSRSGTCTVTVWDLNGQVSSDGSANWTATAGITGASNTSGFTYKYTWKRGQDESSASTLGSESGGGSKTVTLPGQDYYIFYIKATDPEGHTTFVRKTFLYAPSGKIGWQNPSGMYQVSSYNVAPHNYNRGVLSYMSTSRISADATRSQVVEAFIGRAYEYMGTSYVWNYACAPGVGVDCVGLVMQCMYAVGMNTLTGEGDYDCFCPICHWDSGSSGWHSHDANNLRQYGKIQHVSKYEMQRGDLIFWYGHVAIYLGDGQMIQALPGQVYTTSIYNSSSYNYDSIIDVGRLFAA